MKLPKYEKGSITVFLCLILVVLISVVMVCLESAHQAAGKAQAAIAADGAADNVLSHYEEDLYEKYGILAINERLDLKELWDEELKAYSGDAESHVQFQLIESEQYGTTYLCSNNAKEFQKQVNEVMTADSVGDGISLIQKQLKKITEGIGESESLSSASENEEITEMENQNGTDSSDSDDHNVVSLLRTVAAIMKSGPFGYIVEDTSGLSDRTIVMDAMPSVNITNTSEKDDGSILSKAIQMTTDTCSMNLYISKYMNCYTDGGTCDLEYVLGDKTTDLKNLKETVNQLVLLRMALNGAYLLKTRDKYKIAEEAATAIAAATATPELIKVITYAIIAAWAYTEAVCDVRTLIQGGSIPLIKTDSTWKLSLDKAEDVFETEARTKNIKKGLSYKEYLRLLLFFHKRTRNMYRTLDMIQWNERIRDDGFRISQCICQVSFKSKVRIDPIFYSGISGVLGQRAIFQYTHKEVLKYQSAL